MDEKFNLLQGRRPQEQVRLHLEAAREQLDEDTQLWRAIPSVPDLQCRPSLPPRHPQCPARAVCCSHDKGMWGDCWKDPVISTGGTKPNSRPRSMRMGGHGAQLDSGQFDFGQCDLRQLNS